MAGRTEFRPWGSFQVIVNPRGHPWTVKRLDLNPNVQLSTQSHERRGEHWVVVEGMVWAGIGRPLTWRQLEVNNSFFIPPGAIHSLRTGDQAATVIEIMFGHYAEDDIHRYSDIYGRV